MWFLRTKAECRTVTYCDLNPNGWDSCQTELDLWQRPAPEWPPESGVPQQPIRGLGRIFHVLGMPGLAIHISTSVAIRHLPRIGILSLCLGAEPCGAVGPGHCACNAKGNAKWLTNSNRAWDDEEVVKKSSRSVIKTPSKRQIFLGCLGKCKKCLGNVFICLVFNLIEHSMRFNVPTRESKSDTS